MRREREMKMWRCQDASSQPQWTMCDLEEGSKAKVLEMKGLGMTATEIASELGIHRSTVYRKSACRLTTTRTPSNS